MSVPASSLVDLFSFEQNIESGFVAMLAAVGLPDPQSSRSRTIFKTPYTSLYFDNGAGIQTNRHLIPNDPPLRSQFLPINSYNGTLTTDVVTNRKDENQPAHGVLVGQMRLACQMFNIARRWCKYQDVDLITDIREQGSTWEGDDEHDLDTTHIVWNVVHSLNNFAWPAIDLDAIA